MRHWTLSKHRTEQSQEIHAAFNMFVFVFIVLYILKDPGAVSRVRKNSGESFQEGAREPLGSYCKRTSSTTYSNACLSLGTKTQKIFLCPIGGQHLSRCFRDLLKQRILPAVRCTCLASESFLREAFSAKMGPTKPKKSHNLAF